MISEIDIKDWEKAPEVMELYKVKRNSVVSTAKSPEQPFFFGHIDGMYSYCTALNNPLDVFHVFAGELVNVW